MIISNFDKYIHASLYSASPLVLVETADVMAAVERLHRIYKQNFNNRKMFLHSVTTGWMDISMDNDGHTPRLPAVFIEPSGYAIHTQDRTKPVLDYIYSNKEYNNIYVVMSADYLINNQQPLFRQQLREIAYSNIQLKTNNTVILVCSTGTKVPADMASYAFKLTEENLNQEAALKLVQVFSKRDISDLYMAGDKVKEQVAATLAGLSYYEALMIMSIEAENIDNIVMGKDKKHKLDLSKYLRSLQKAKQNIINNTSFLHMEDPVMPEDVCGMDKLKEWLANKAKVFTPEAKEKNIPRPKGICLVGPPGTGKSLVSKLAGYYLDRTIIRFNLSNIFNSHVGASEHRMTDALNRVEAMSPCILFIDEGDKSVQAGSSATDGGVSQRILGQFLTWLQNTQADVFTVLTANRPYAMPPELMRAGRFDVIWGVDLPNSDERQAIFDMHMNRYDATKINIQLETRSFNSAEVELLAKECIAHSYITESEITQELVENLAKNIIPASKSFQDYDVMIDWINKHARKVS